MESAHYLTWKAILDIKDCLLCRNMSGKIYKIGEVINLKEHCESYYAFKPIMDNPIKLDFTGCHYLGEVHKILKERFGLPEYYGENWDALWDCLDYLFVDDGERIVEVYGLQDLPDDLRKECDKMLEVFDDVHQDTPNVIFRMIF